MIDLTFVFPMRDRIPFRLTSFFVVMTLRRKSTNHKFFKLMFVWASLQSSCIKRTACSNWRAITRIRSIVTIPILSLLYFRIENDREKSPKIHIQIKFQLILATKSWTLITVCSYTMYEYGALLGEGIIDCLEAIIWIHALERNIFEIMFECWIFSRSKELLQ